MSVSAECDGDLVTQRTRCHTKLSTRKFKGELLWHF